MAFFDCLGARRRRSHAPSASHASPSDTDPLLPPSSSPRGLDPHDDTPRQRRLHRKLHAYQMLRALGAGYLPDQTQLALRLRALRASDALNPPDHVLSDPGRLLFRRFRSLLAQLEHIVLHKLPADRAQDLAWSLAHAHVALGLPDQPWRSLISPRASPSSAVQSLQLLSSLLFANADFRLFLADLQTVGRQVFRDVALSTESAAAVAAARVDPAPAATNDAEALQLADAQPAPDQSELKLDAKDVGQSVRDAGKSVAGTAKQSAEAHLTGPERHTLIRRLQAAAVKLRQRPDYNESVSVLVTIFREYVSAQARVADGVVDTAKDSIKSNPLVQSAVDSFVALISCFGNRAEWEALGLRWRAVIDHVRSDPDFDQLVEKSAFALQKVFTDPAVLNSTQVDLSELRRTFNERKTQSNTLSADLDALLGQLQRVWISLKNDKEVSGLVETALQIFDVVSPSGSSGNSGAFTRDLVNVIAPSLIQAIQHVPIPRLEISTPDFDLLLENLIFEPGKTVNSSSFLPFRFRFETYNDIEIRKAHLGTVSRMTSLATIKIEGLSLRAEDVGFWLRVHSGILHLADEGLMSFELDERGVDIHLDVEIGRDQLESVLTLRAVRVRIHKLSYTLRRSKFTCLACFFKPLIRLAIRKTIEKQLAAAVADMFHAANRELLFMRERLRATRISQPQDMATFFKAVLARLTPADNPDVGIRLGVGQPGRDSVFSGVYAPGSIVKTWVEEGQRAGEIVDDFKLGGWRNEIFDALPPM